MPTRCPIHSLRSPTGTREVKTRRDWTPKKSTHANKVRNSPRWKRLTIAIQARDPVCCDPLAKHSKVVTPTTTTHHLKPIETHPDLAFDPANLVGLCAGCHSSVEILERRGIPTEELVRTALAACRQDQPIGELEPMSSAGCRPNGSGIYCVRMNRIKSTHCAGCAHAPSSL